MRPTSYDKRNVRFEDIHEVTADDLQEFVRLGEPREGYSILDIGCGYGAVSSALIEFVATKATGISRISIDLVDESSVQLDRARAEVEAAVRRCGGPATIMTAYYEGTFPDDYPDWNERYDVIFAKQVIHEWPKGGQNLLVNAMFKALRPGGRLVVWEIALDPDPEIADLFRNAIHEKDRLAEFETLQTNRHFLDRKDLLCKIQDGGGAAPSVLRIVPYRFRSLSRLGPELNGDKGKLRKLNAYITREYERLPEPKRRVLNFEQKETSVEFDVPVVIASSVKPGRNTSTSLSLFSNKIFERPDTSEFQRHVIEAALSDELGGELLKEVGPCLLRFSLVQWNDKRRFELVSSGLDFVFHWGERWLQPAEAYLAYLASLFARAGGSPERSFNASATGFVARWFAGCSSAGVGHFELQDDVVRLVAFTIPARVVDETVVTLPRGWHSVLKAFHDHIRATAPPAHCGIGPFGVRIAGNATTRTADDFARKIAAVPDGNKMLDSLANNMLHQPGGEPAPDLILRLASYLRLTDCNHAYYLVPPSILFKKIPGFRPGDPARFETGNLHITTQGALDPGLLIELLHWQTAVWQALTAVDVLRTLIKDYPNA